MGGLTIMLCQSLREEVLEANLALVRHGLVTLTWGNVSGVDREQGLLAIKPSGVSYDILKAEHIVLVKLADGATVDSAMKPSSDTPTHLHLYRSFPEIGGVVHTHSRHATAWAQARRPLPCFGTTHADHFYGSVPCTRMMTGKEIQGEYELETGVVIEEAIRQVCKSALDMPAVLVAGHGPFTWGKNAGKAVENSVALEASAEMGIASLALTPNLEPLPQVLLDRHFLRKHGANAYYGQGQA